MASLQDQLLKSGLVDKNKAKKANRAKQKQANIARKAGVQVTNEVSSSAWKEREKRTERDRELNLKKQKASDQKAFAAQVRQLIEINKLDRDQGEISYSFVFENKVKNIAVNEDVKKQLTQGRLAIVTLLVKNSRKFEIVPAPVADKIAQRDAECVVSQIEKTGTRENENDPYADYQIPDDLTW